MHIAHTSEEVCDSIHLLRIYREQPVSRISRDYCRYPTSSTNDEDDVHFAIHAAGRGRFAYVMSMVASYCCALGSTVDAKRKRTPLAGKLVCEAAQHFGVRMVNEAALANYYYYPWAQLYPRPRDKHQLAKQTRSCSFRCNSVAAYRLCESVWLAAIAVYKVYIFESDWFDLYFNTNWIIG